MKQKNKQKRKVTQVTMRGGQLQLRRNWCAVENTEMQAV